jgi:glycosyltransferase involved in cell wall biosynthesis
MIIGIDGGALCSDSRYGTYRYSTELIATLGKDSSHTYHLYSFCTLPQRDLLVTKQLKPAHGWMKIAVSTEILRTKPDVFLALNQALPVILPRVTIAISHGLSFYQYPEYYLQDYNRLASQLKDYVTRADRIVVSSTRIVEELSVYAPGSEEKAVVIPFGVPHHFLDLPPLTRKRFLFYVGSDQPIKRVDLVVQAYRRLRKKPGYQDMKLVLAGVSRNRIEEGVTVLPQVQHEQLAVLYRQAYAYVTASRYESFNFPVLEALSVGCPVVGLESAIIPELQPYVRVVTEPADLSDALIGLKPGTESVQNTVHARFSWKQYAKQLTTLYQV